MIFDFLKKDKDKVRVQEGKRQESHSPLLFGFKLPANGAVERNSERTEALVKGLYGYFISGTPRGLLRGMWTSHTWT